MTGWVLGPGEKLDPGGIWVNDVGWVFPYYKGREVHAGNFWSKRDNKILKALYPHREISVVAMVLGRSREAVTKQASNLGIRHKVLGPTRGVSDKLGRVA